jgi:hypothetical protein
VAEDVSKLAFNPLASILGVEEMELGDTPKPPARGAPLLCILPLGGTGEAELARDTCRQRKTTGREDGCCTLCLIPAQAGIQNGPWRATLRRGRGTRQWVVERNETRRWSLVFDPLAPNSLSPSLSKRGSRELLTQSLRPRQRSAAPSRRISVGAHCSALDIVRIGNRSLISHLYVLSGPNHSVDRNL